MEIRKEFSLEEGDGLTVQSANVSLDVGVEETASPYVLYDVTDESTAEQVRVDRGEGGVVLTITPDPAAPRGLVKLRLPAAEREVTLETSNGAITMRGLSGKIDANTTNGGVEMRDLSGDITVVCANGSVDAERITGTLDASTANGKITAREARLAGGSIKSGNGRIALQVAPEQAGASVLLSVFAGNGRVELALPQDTDFRIKVRTRGRLHNHLESYSVTTEDETTVVARGTGAFGILIQSFQGSVCLERYEEFGKSREDEPSFPGFDTEDLNGFLSHLAGCFKDMPRQFDFDFSKEIPRIARKMQGVGAKFGRMGEEFSRQFHEHHREDRREQGSREVDMILELLKEGKISAAEAEKLINAVRAGK